MGKKFDVTQPEGPRYSYPFEDGDRVRVVVERPAYRAWQERPVVGELGVVVSHREGDPVVQLDNVHPGHSQVCKASDLMPEHPTAQQLFEYAAWHMLKRLQGRRAYDSALGSCAYQTNVGDSHGVVLHCAVGGLLPEGEDYASVGWVFGITAGVDDKIYEVCKRLGINEDPRERTLSYTPHGALSEDLPCAAPRLNLLGRLQHIHDNVGAGRTAGRRLHMWRRSLKRLAKRNGYEVPAWL